MQQIIFAHNKLIGVFFLQNELLIIYHVTWILKSLQIQTIMRIVFLIACLFNIALNQEDSLSAIIPYATL